MDYDYLKNNMVNIINNSTIFPTILNGVYNNNDVEQYISIGWRLKPTIPELAEGYRRTTIIYIEGDGRNAVAQYADINIADEQAAIAQAEAENAAIEAAKPYQISKIKVLNGLNTISSEAIGAFLAYLNSDPMIKLLWDNSVVLDSDNSFVTNAIPTLQEIIGEVDVNEFLRSCKSDLF